MASVAVCEGTVAADPSGVAVCSTGWASVSYETVVPFDPSQLSAADCAQAFGLGFVLLLGVWAACKSVEVVLRMIK